MATGSSYFDGASSKGWYCRLYYSYTQTTTTNIVLTLDVYCGANSSYNNNPNSAYYTIQGTKTYKTYSFSSSGWYTIGSKTISVAASQTSVNVSANFCTGQSTTYTPNLISVSGTITFPSIDTSKLYISRDLPDFIAQDSPTNTSISVKAAGMTSGSTYTCKWYQKTASATSYSVLSTVSNSTGSFNRNITPADGKSFYCEITSGNQSVTSNILTFRCGLSAATIIRNPVPIIYIPKVYKAGWKNSIPKIKINSQIKTAFAKINL